MVGEAVGVGFGVGEAVGVTVGLGVVVGFGEAVAELVGLGVVVGFGEAVAELVGLGVVVGFGVGEAVGVTTTGTVPKKVNSSNTPVGVFSNEAKTAVAGAVPEAGILLAKKFDAVMKPGPSPRRAPNWAQLRILLRVPFSTKNSPPLASLMN